ncbi:hypothetical protein D3C83_127130 [compost metagenome]
MLQIASDGGVLHIRLNLVLFGIGIGEAVVVVARGRIKLHRLLPRLRGCRIVFCSERHRTDEVVAGGIVG